MAAISTPELPRAVLAMVPSEVQDAARVWSIREPLKNAKLYSLRVVEAVPSTGLLAVVFGRKSPEYRRISAPTIEESQRTSILSQTIGPFTVTIYPRDETTAETAKNTHQVESTNSHTCLVIQLDANGDIIWPEIETADPEGLFRAAIVAQWFVEAGRPVSLSDQGFDKS